MAARVGQLSHDEAWAEVMQGPRWTWGRQTLITAQVARGLATQRAELAQLSLGMGDCGACVGLNTPN